MKILNYLDRLNSFNKVLSSVVITKKENNTIYLDIENELLDIFNILNTAKNNKKNIFIIGNGGSAGVASHAVTDFFNVAKIKATTLHESSLLTCLANDYGYDNALKIMIERLISTNDILIAISSSGKSKNILNAVDIANRLDAITITLSGFDQNNLLRKSGVKNIWLDSTDYGFVEVGHQFLLHNIADRFNVNLSL